MRISTNYIGMIALILIIVALTSGCIYNDDTKIYSGYGVSFKYPGSWLVSEDKVTVSNIIFVSNGNSFNGTDFQVQKIPNNGMPGQEMINEIRSAEQQGWQKIYNGTITIDGCKAYDDIFIVNETGYKELMRSEHICFVKNGVTYLLILQAPDKDFDKEKPNFDIIINSFKVQ